MLLGKFQKFLLEGVRGPMYHTAGSCKKDPKQARRKQCAPRLQQLTILGSGLVLPVVWPEPSVLEGSQRSLFSQSHRCLELFSNLENSQPVYAEATAAGTGLTTKPLMHE